MAIEKFNTRPLPEVSSVEAAAYPRLLGLVASLDLPGVIIRAAARLPKLADIPLRNVRGPFGADYDLANTATAVADPAIDVDIGLHQDFYGLDVRIGHEARLNFHLTRAGQAHVTLLRLARPAEQLWTESTQMTVGSVARQLYAQGKVNTEVLQPMAHTAQLQAGDMLAFTDGYHAHDFQTLNDGIRLSRVRLFAADMRAH